MPSIPRSPSTGGERAKKVSRNQPVKNFVATLWTLWIPLPVACVERYYVLQLLEYSGQWAAGIFYALELMPGENDMKNTRVFAKLSKQARTVHILQRI